MPLTDVIYDVMMTSYRITDRSDVMKVRRGIRFHSTRTTRPTRKHDDTDYDFTLDNAHAARRIAMRALVQQERSQRGY